MSNGNHSFVRMVKLKNVRGRVNYITDLKRQENLYATCTNVPKKCWYHLAKENQRDFRNSGTTGKCIEARELIIMLPPSLIEYDHEAILKYFTGVFAEKYDVACQSALHHNKTKTNLHIHLIFSSMLLRCITSSCSFSDDGYGPFSLGGKAAGVISRTTSS